MSQFSIVLHISISHVTISSLANGIHQSISFISRVKKVDWKMKNVSIKSTDQIDPWFFFRTCYENKNWGRKWDYHASNSFYQFWMLFFIISWWMCSIFPRFGWYLPSVLRHRRLAIFSSYAEGRKQFWQNFAWLGACFLRRHNFHQFFTPQKRHHPAACSSIRRSLQR